MQETFFHKIIQKLAEHKVKYLIVGGTAVNLHGIPRFTKDLDLMIDLDRENVNRLIKAANDLGYRPRAPVQLRDLADPVKREQWVTQKNAVVFTLNDPEPPFFAVDIFLKNPLNFKRAFSMRTTLKLNGYNVELVSIKDLIKLKQLANRLQDLSDIEYLRKIQRRKK